MNRYEEYKDSGVEWIGEIPCHWKIKKVKYLIEDEGGIKIGPFGSSLKLDTLTDDGIKVYGQGNIIKDDFTLGHRHIPIERFESDFSQYEILEGDILITMMGTTGKSKVFKREFKRGILDSHLLRLRFKRNSFSNYLFVIILQESDYVFHQLKLNSKGAIMEGLNSSIVKELSLLTPPLSEQQQIVSFLDTKTSLIDSLIEKTLRKIELLKEKRTSLINEVVTKGLNPNVEMKESGVEWIGEIPSHWVKSKVKWELTFHNNQRIPIEASKREEMTGDYPYYGASGIIDYVNDYIFNGEYILVGEDGANILMRSSRMSFIADGQFWVNNHAHILSSKFGPNKYFCEQIELNDFTTIASGAAQPKLTKESLGDIVLIVPPLDEQQQIVEYLDHETQLIDNTISIEEKRIDLLKEYRQSLISEVVTGKRKVV